MEEPPEKSRHDRLDDAQLIEVAKNAIDEEETSSPTNATAITVDTPSIDTATDTTNTATTAATTPTATVTEAAAKQLERTRISDSLNLHLESKRVPSSHNNNSNNNDNNNNKCVYLHGTVVASSLRAAQKRLEKNVRRDHVGRLLGARPDAEILTQRGITQPSAQAGRIQSAAKRLERNFTSNKIAHLLEHRAHAEDLQHKDILGSQSVASSIQRPQRDLQKNLAKSNLYHALKFRPSISELMKKGVYPTPLDKEGRGEREGGGEGEEEEGAVVEGEEKSDGEEGDYEEEEMGDKSSLEYPDQFFQSNYNSFQKATTRKRSKCFHLTRILLKSVATMTEAGELSADQKGIVKDLIIDQDPTILAVAENYVIEQDLADFKDSIVRLAGRRERMP